MSKIVLGLGFGDEGKGMFTDYLCSHTYNPLVIRFSGGHQVGHTVVTDNHRHIFSNFGSGTLRGVPTYWSKFCTVEPIGLIRELEILIDKGINPVLYIDERCPITTPYDIYSNQKSEKINSHGSVGVGFGATIEREENFYSLTFLDLFYPKVLLEKLKNIEKYYLKKFNYILTETDSKTVINKIEITEFLNACHKIVKHISIKKVLSPKEKSGYDYVYNYIFEGSQGLLLDQHHGFFPHVTRSNTGIENARGLVPEIDISDIFLVTRAYQTRHGKGFMTNENIPHNIKENPDETNKDHKYQGKFRRSLLDVSLLEYAILKHGLSELNKSLVITCLDHVENEYRFTYKGQIYSYSNELDFSFKIAEILGHIKTVYLSKSPNSKYIDKKSLDI